MLSFISKIYIIVQHSKKSMISFIRKEKDVYATYPESDFFNPFSHSGHCILQPSKISILV